MALTKVSGSILKDPLNLGGEVSIGGTLTYQDVTNVDAIGIITARAGINVSGGQLDVGSNVKIGNAGVATATNFKTGSSNLHSTGLTVGNNFFHSTGINVGTGATIHVPASNTLTFGTNSNERLRIYSDGDAKFSSKLGVGVEPVETFDVRTTGSAIALIGSTNAGGSYLKLDGDANGDGSGGDYARLVHDTDGRFYIDNLKSTADIVFRNGASANERLRIASDGRVYIGNTQDSSPYSWNLGLQVSGTSTNAGLSIRRDQSGSGGALLMFVKSRGSLNGNTVVQDGDQIV